MNGKTFRFVCIRLDCIDVLITDPQYSQTDRKLYTGFQTADKQLSTFAKMAFMPQ